VQSFGAGVQCVWVVRFLLSAGRKKSCTISENTISPNNLDFIIPTSYVLLLGLHILIAEKLPLDIHDISNRLVGAIPKHIQDMPHCRLGARVPIRACRFPSTHVSTTPSPKTARAPKKTLTQCSPASAETSATHRAAHSAPPPSPSSPRDPLPPASSTTPCPTTYDADKRWDRPDLTPRLSSARPPRRARRRAAPLPCTATPPPTSSW
jgi:hypothetical protein